MSWKHHVERLNAWQRHVERLRAGETVQFRPRGRSMEPTIMSGQLVTVEPVVPRPGCYPEGSIAVEEGDVVLCKVGGRYYVHLVVDDHDGTGTRFLIGNKRGYTNGWTPAEHIYGRVVKVED